MPAVVQKAKVPFNRQSGNVVRHFDFGNRSQVVVIIDSDDIGARSPCFTGHVGLCGVNFPLIRVGNQRRGVLGQRDHPHHFATVRIKNVGAT